LLLLNIVFKISSAKGGSDIYQLGVGDTIFIAVGLNGDRNFDLHDLIHFQRGGVAV
jgi:hypothetical protein